MSIFDELQKYYSQIYFDKETNYATIYRDINQYNKNVCLKVIEKDLLKMGDYNFLLEQINREEKITKICDSEHIVNLISKI